MPEDTGDLGKTIDRLRRQRSELFRNGSCFGTTWAKDVATLSELRRLWQTRLDQGAAWDGFFVDYGWRTIVISILGLLSPVRDEVEGDQFEAENDQVRAFWRDTVKIDPNSDEVQSADFVQGFAEGAIDIFETVKSEL
jgi:hypothetical protein